MKRLKDPIQQKVLVLVAPVLVLLGALFIIPMVKAVIGLLWFVLKVWCIIYLVISSRGKPAVSL